MSRSHDTPSTGDAVVLPFRGELDAHDAAEVRRTIAATLDEGLAARVVLDLAEVAFLDSTILGALMGAVRRVRESGGEVRVVLPDTPARRIFEITGVVAALDVYPSRRAALGGG